MFAVIFPPFGPAAARELNMASGELKAEEYEQSAGLHKSFEDCFGKHLVSFVIQLMEGKLLVTLCTVCGV